MSLILTTYKVFSNIGDAFKKSAFFAKSAISNMLFINLLQGFQHHIDMVFTYPLKYTLPEGINLIKLESQFFRFVFSYSLEVEELSNMDPGNYKAEIKRQRNVRSDQESVIKTYVLHMINVDKPKRYCDDIFQSPVCVATPGPCTIDQFSIGCGQYWPETLEIDQKALKM